MTPASSHAPPPPTGTTSRRAPRSVRIGSVWLLCLALCGLATDGEAGTLREPTLYDAAGGLSAKARQALATGRRPMVQALFTAARLSFPPRSMVFRVFKDVGRLDVWGADSGRLVPVATYGVCYASGGLGPKRKEGDSQVPEGFYTLDLFNPRSSYHLSMRVSYPNRSDRILGHPKTPGGAIMIHGSCVSIGCLAMSDERIEELWAMAAAMRDAKRTVAVHILPTHDIAALVATGAQPEHHAFWRNLDEGDRVVRDEGRLPIVSVAKDGVYTFR